MSDGYGQITGALVLIDDNDATMFACLRLVYFH